jgi:hypothetical protein
MKGDPTSAAAPGLNLAVIFHEVERRQGLHDVIASRQNPEEAQRQASELMRLLDGFLLLRKDSKKQHDARKLPDAGRFSASRF